MSSLTFSTPKSMQSVRRALAACRPLTPTIFTSGHLIPVNIGIVPMLLPNFGLPEGDHHSLRPSSAKICAAVCLASVNLMTPSLQAVGFKLRLAKGSMADELAKCKERLARRCKKCPTCRPLCTLQASKDAPDGRMAHWCPRLPMRGLLAPAAGSAPASASRALNTLPCLGNCPKLSFNRAFGFQVRFQVSARLTAANGWQARQARNASQGRSCKSKGAPVTIGGVAWAHGKP